MGGYRRGVAHRVLHDDYGVTATCGERDGDCEVWKYTRTTADGETLWVPHTFDRGLAAYPPDTLREICRELRLEENIGSIIARIIALDGWVGRSR